MGNPDGLTVAVRGPVPRLPLSPAVEAQLLAIGREALANVAKHSAARRAWVSIESSDGSGSLEIRDNGSGFDARWTVRATTGSNRCEPALRRRAQP